MSEELRVWVGCLACYNAGNLRGEWVDAEDAAEYRPHGAGTVADAEHEETWCFDHEGFGPGMGEMSPSEATAIAESLSTYGTFTNIPAAAVFAYSVNAGVSVAELDGAEVEEAYCGEYESELVYANEFAEETIAGIEADTILARYFDYEAFARDLFMGDYWSAPSPDGGVFVFRSI